MELKIKYPGLEETLLYLKQQVKESVPFAKDFLPDGYMSAKEIFDYLKRETIYINDPFRIELLQSMPTLFGEKNQHRIYGAGDCDCFTIAALASLIAKGYTNLKVALAGRNKNMPAHIYVLVNDRPFDLTNTDIDKERPYPFIQYLPFKL